MSDSILMAVTADVMFHDGAQWIRPDIVNGLQNIPESHHLSNIQLIKASSNDSAYRIVAVRIRDSKRLVNQLIFERLRYKEATPSFHQWRNENKQVIGLNFPSEQEARRFYSAVRQVLEISAANYQQQQWNQVESTYQEPQNYNRQNSINCQQNNHEFYASQNHLHHPEDGMRINNINAKVAVKNVANANHNNSQQQQQQSGALFRRASQGSNISSSTGGSMQGQIYAPTSIAQHGGNQCQQDRTNCEFYAPALYSSGQQQQSAHPNNNNGPLPPALPTNGSALANGKPAPVGNAPPPPPPPPPDLKSALCAGKQPPSFADQLKHVQLRKNSSGNGITMPAKVSPGTPVSGSLPSGGGVPVPKYQNNGGGGNHDLISELADRLNKRKMNAEASTSASDVQTQQRPLTGQLNNNRQMNSNPIATSHRKVPSGSSLSSQDDSAAGAAVVSLVAAPLLETQQKQTTPGGEYEHLKTTTVTAGDLERMKRELMEQFAQEMAKLRAEVAQTLREEIAKMTNNSN